ncbi:short-chain dehydrogenase/reductase SDR [Paenibacillus curdlanolyticus YK9]|uniref:Enoyl-[acyl-carrier-protein] reductase [NADH] n=1 Tax=Paenibacillus curdlanolyticus YK9 TaxID=717606 RepID=E0I8M3_9BACL|nr:enoyl-ACP reductase [Paenibacillus curdlanolyticus]EFM11528.1 short-chain dehydrogenase/reductase SDR [Paenibacillus curdlanolyticus YK9]
MMRKLLEGKKGIVTGVVNHRSIAWEIARHLAEEGAEIGFTYRRERKWVEKLAGSIGADFIEPCDVQDDQQIRQVCDKFAERFGGIDFIVHAAAYADGEELQAGVINTSRDGFLRTLDVTAYSIVPFCHYARPYFRPGASVLALSYLGSNRVCAGYNVLGIAKSALETTCKYLAADLGPEQVRVNVISAGPIRTLAAFGLPNFKEMVEKRANQSPLRRNVTQEDVAKAALYLMSDLASGTTGEVMYVDAGYNIMGTWADSEVGSAMVQG